MSDTNWQSYGHEVIWVGFEKDMAATLPDRGETSTSKSNIKVSQETPHTIIDLDRLMEIMVYG